MRQSSGSYVTLEEDKSLLPLEVREVEIRPNKCHWQFIASTMPKKFSKLFCFSLSLVIIFGLFVGICATRPSEGQFDKPVESRQIGNRHRLLKHARRLMATTLSTPTKLITKTAKKTSSPKPTKPTATTTSQTENKSALLVLGSSKCETGELCQWRHQTIKLNDQLEQVNTSFTFSNSIVDSCSVTWRGEQFIFGGSGHNSRQISRIDKESCTLETFGKLEFDFDSGACTVANDRIYLCFDKDTPQSCYYGDSPLSITHVLPQSIYQHSYTRITSSGDGESILALGSYSHANSELFNIEQNQWSSVSDEYGGHRLIFAAPVIWAYGSFYVVGGFKDTTQADLHATNAIYMLDANNEWKKAGHLQQKRHGHAVIPFEDYFVVIGGNSEEKEMASQKDLPVVTEKCYLVDEHFNCTAVDHHVKGLYSYPEAFVVDANFCEDN